MNAVAACDNVDECLDATSCGENQICSDNHGAYNCSCGVGYSGTVGIGAPTTCSNVDECQAG